MSVVKFSITVQDSTQEVLARQAKIHGITQGELLDAILPSLDFSVFAAQFEAIRAEKLKDRQAKKEERKHKRELLERLGNLPEAKLKELLANVNQEPV